MEHTHSYVVELERWNIKNDGTEAMNTTNGINNAFKWAFENGFNTVVLPQGQYLIEKNSSIKLSSNTWYKLYDCLFVKEPNNLNGYEILLLDGVKNVTIEGAKVKGDRESHDYSNGGTHEGGHGIMCKNSCERITVLNCEAFECTGDGFTTFMDFSTIGGIQHPSHFSKGDINNHGNIDILKSNYTTVSKFYDVTGSIVRNVGYFFYSGDGYGGYGPGCNLNKTKIKVHFYKSDNTYLGFRYTRSYEYIYLDTLPLGTSKVRFSFLQNFDLMNGNLHYVMCARIPQYIQFINCKSYKNRRLGASINGGRFITFDSCEIFNNSNPMINSTGTNPGYGIDIEDGYMTNQKITIRNCHIYDNRAGACICISTRGVFVENNKFHGTFAFSGSGDDYFSLNNMYYGNITGKSITSEVETDGTFCTFRNDSVFGQTVSISAGNTTLENCVFSKSTLSIGGETAKLFNCKLTFDDPDKGEVIRLSSKNLEIYNSLFDIRRAKGTATASYNSSEKIILSNVKFLTNSTSGGHYVGTKNLIMDDCEFIHSGNTINYSRMMVSESMRVEHSLFKNLSFRFDGGNIYGTEVLALDPGYSTHTFINNKIIWDAPYSTYSHEALGPGISFLYIPRLEITKNVFHVIDKGTSLGNLYTLRIFIENHLVLKNNSIITTKSPQSNTKGTIVLEGAFRKNGSTLVKPKSTIIDTNNVKINSEIIYTNNVNNQL